MIEIAVWILAIVGVVGIIQNSIQLKALKQDQEEKNRLYNECKWECLLESLKRYKDGRR